MIWVRWAIPDMSNELRDKIRREAYITNDIIIKQEAERARELSNGRFNLLGCESLVTVKLFQELTLL